MTELIKNRLNTLYGINAATTTPDPIKAVCARVNEVTEKCKEDLAREWAISKGFDPEDKKIPMAFFIGYMAYVESHMKSRYEMLYLLQDVLRGWGWDIKMNMQSHELVYKGRIAE